MNNLLSTDKLRVWGTDIDEGTISQAYKVAKLPILAGPVALMPDAHVGIGSTVGTVIATKNAIVPSCVGVDIGCGMISVQLDLHKHELPSDLKQLVHEFTRSIPAGLAEAHSKTTSEAELWFANNSMPGIMPRGISAEQSTRQLGTLGSGNHFVEICTDIMDSVWVVLHSGSRGIGNKIANRHIDLAKKNFQTKLEDPDLAWLDEGTEEFAAYIEQMEWAQRYAFQNRELMMNAALRQISYFLGKKGEPIFELQRINCHHNFAKKEIIESQTERGQIAWITRKGAISARKDQWGIIPGSMATGCYIVKGLGNPLSYYSSSHGAGRRMSRGQAKRTLTVDSLKEMMGNRAWLDDKAQAFLDEHPDSYKSLDQVMLDQTDLTRPIWKLESILNYKGSS